MFVLLTLVLLIGGLFGLFWGGSLLAQSYLYNVPAERMPLRALIGAAVMSLFLTFWVFIDQKSPDTYDTILNFSSDENIPLDEFQAVRLYNAGYERTVTYTYNKSKRTEGRRATDFDDEQGNSFTRATTDWIIIAIIVNEDGQESRFETPIKTVNSSEGERLVFDKEEDSDEVVYKEVDGDRYIRSSTAGTMIDPRTGVLLGNLLLNLVHFLLWWGVFWLALRYHWGHALGFGFLFWISFLILIIPLLLEQN